MIEFTRSYTCNGKTYSSLEEAKSAAIAETIVESNAMHDCEAVKSIAKAIVQNSERIVDILTTKANSRPKARKSNGGSKARKPKKEPVQTAPAQAA